MNPMRRFLALCALLGATFLAAPCRGDDTAKERAPGEMFDKVVEVLRKGFYDAEFRRSVVPRLADQYREQARAATTVDAERNVIEQMLGEIPASHLGLLSEAAHEQMMRNLAGEKAPTFGLELARLEDGFFVAGVLEGGPAEQAGVKRGDRVVRIDDDDPAHSPRLDWRTDDAALPDPPAHALLAKEGEKIALQLERREGESLQIDVAAADYSAFEAARQSAEVLTVNGHSVAYIHFWYVHSRGMDKLLERLIQKEFKDCEALVLDLRGRGGSAHMVTSVLRVLAGRNSKWRKPIVALIDNQTRSAKEMLAYELKTRKLGVLVGQITAGALLPATFAKVGSDSVLMYPAFSLGKHSDEIEGKGVAPDIEVESPVPFSAGADPIRDAGMRKALELAVERARVLQPVM